MSDFDRRNWLKAAVLAAGAAGMGRLALAAGEGGGEFAGVLGASWKAKKAQAIEVAEAMPADKYDFKPTPEMRSFGELMAHIAGAMYFFAATAAGEDVGDRAKGPEEKTPETILPFLNESFDYAGGVIASMDDARAAEVIELFGQFTLSRGGVLRFLRDHVTHHLGYSVPYLRLAGVTKIPAYRFTGTNQSPV